MIRPINAADIDAWVALRHALWPDGLIAEHRKEAVEALTDPNQTAFVSEDVNQRIDGFIEVSLHSHAEGCTTSPVGYVEGWYVNPDMRGRGVGRTLMAAAEAWARARGCREMASDAFADNAGSRAAHRRLGFEETARVVHFRRTL